MVVLSCHSECHSTSDMSPEDSDTDSILSLMSLFDRCRVNVYVVVTLFFKKEIENPTEIDIL
jgi:hypothetical protein